MCFFWGIFIMVYSNKKNFKILFLYLGQSENEIQIWQYRAVESKHFTTWAKKMLNLWNFI